MRLVIDSGSPAFPAPIHVGYPWAGSKERFLEIVDGIFDDVWFTNNAKRVQELEGRIAELQGVKHCIAVCNGTSALQIGLKAMDITGEVLMPSFTFVGTAHAAEWIGLTPVFCDIDPVTLTLDPEDVRRKMGPKVSCILPVNLFGNACEFDQLQAIADERGLRVLYDSAHAIGCKAGGMPIGGQGDMQILSFHATKIFHTFEGGALLTNDDVLAEKSRLMRNYGFVGYEEVEALGINAKMSEISAAYGLASLEDLPMLISINHRNHSLYEERLSSIPGVQFLSPPAGMDSNHQYVTMLVDGGRFGMQRDTLYRLLWAENVRARRYFSPGCHRLGPYRDMPETTRGQLPVTEDIARRILCLPTGHAVDERMIDTICGLISEASRRADDVKTWESALMRRNSIQSVVTPTFA